MNFLLALTLIVTISVQSRQENVTLDPCNDFYDYVCSNDTRSITELNFTSLFEDREILNPNISFPNNGTYITLDQILSPYNLTMWYMAVKLMDTPTVGSEHFVETSREYAKKKNNSERFSFAVEKLENINLTSTNIFYNSLYANIEVLNQLNLPAAEENEFLHHIFDLMKNNTIEEIWSSALSNESKKEFEKELSKSKGFFGLLDYNNVTMLEESKLVYEAEYYRLKSLLSPDDLDTEIAEKIIRLGASDTAIKNLRIPGYQPVFLFSAFASNMANEAFNQNSNIYIGIVTRNDLQQPISTIADTFSVLAHELMHFVYPFGIRLLPSNVTKAANKCTQDEVKMMGDSDAVKPIDGWFSENITHEDLPNLLGLRMVMKMVARKSANEEQLKNALETILSGLCIQGKPKNSILPHHHPFEISINTAVRQYPLFSSLYGCRLGDRMFAEPEKFCNPLGGDVNLEDYKIKNDTEDVGGFFNYIMDTANALEQKIASAKEQKIASAFFCFISFFQQLPSD
ncbi:Peptidase_M13 domain-containing protein [Caenorhabditis elegans]|uniref:Peptidase_M13 domain-containing protein n=2 Tax=Caenorhabditis elegans TaxID=6239 RepID=H2KYF5_CAEEL|nr:Peptidase_M13 domain-containing protein [Caenorhabditis elegans]CCD62961.1 Peptidase_M13 domain-containing protein [Caenorhabditis elegans]|eukprot:NP_001256023.1 Uncharacterized protein CELE_C17B7.8 [Caenorhabditis elegans]